MNGMSAAQIMDRKLHTVRPTDTVHDAVRMLLRLGLTGAPVIDGDRRVLGMLTERSCVQALMRAVADRLPPSRVRDVMTDVPVIVAPDAQFLTVAHHLLHNTARRILVVDNGQLVGHITRRDLLRAAVAAFDRSESREAAALYLSAFEGRKRPAGFSTATPNQRRVGPRGRTT
ncbi:MAG: CBS domain-containing protein [Myxococcota bacterium]|jgi:CBS domain-containing protein